MHLYVATVICIMVSMNLMSLTFNKKEIVLSSVCQTNNIIFHFLLLVCRARKEGRLRVHNLLLPTLQGFE